MATNTVGSGNTMRPYRNCRVQSFQESQTQTFVVGDVLILDTATNHEYQVKKGGADPVSVVGVAAEAASGTAGTKVQVYVADEKAEFRAVIDSGATLSRSALGAVYGLVNDSTNTIWRVDTTDTSNTRVVVTEVIGGWTFGDTNAEVAFRFLNAGGNSGGNRVPYRE